MPASHQSNEEKKQDFQKVAKSSPEIVLSLHEAGIPPEENILVIISRNHFANEAVKALKLVKDAGFIELDKFIYLMLLASENLNAYKLALAFQCLHKAEIPLTDKIIIMIVNAYRNAEGVAEALIHLKNHHIELTDAILNVIDRCWYYAKDVAQTMLSLHAAKIPLKEEDFILPIFNKYIRTYWDESTDPYSFSTPQPALALLMLAENMDVTQEIIAAVIAVETEAKAAADHILNLYNNKVPLIPSLLKAITPRVYNGYFYIYNPPLPAILINLKQEYGDLLTGKLLEAAVIANANANEAVKGLLTLKKERIFTDKILEALNAQNHAYTKTIIKALLFLKANKIFLTEGIILAIIEANLNAYGMAQELLFYKSKAIKLSDEVLMAMGSSAQHLRIIRMALMSLYEVKISLTDKSMESLVKCNAFSLNIAYQFLFLQRFGFFITDTIIQNACAPKVDIQQFAKTIINEDDKEHESTASYMSSIIKSDESKWPKVILEIIASFFSYPGEKPAILLEEYPMGNMTPSPFVVQSCRYEEVEVKYAEREEKTPSAPLRRSLSMGALPFNSGPLNENKETPDKKEKSALVKHSLVARQKELPRSQSCDSFLSRTPRL